MKHVLDFLFPDIEKGNYTALIVIVCVIFVLWLLTAVARWRTYSKMGEAGWKAFIPLYSYFVLYDKCWDKRHAWDYVLTTIVYACYEAGLYKGDTDTELIAILCSIGELIFAINLLYLTVRINFRVSKAFGHGFWFGLGLWLFPFIFTFVLGFGKSKYVGVPALHKGKNQ